MRLSTTLLLAIAAVLSSSARGFANLSPAHALSTTRLQYSNWDAFETLPDSMELMVSFGGDRCIHVHAQHYLHFTNAFRS